MSTAPYLDRIFDPLRDVLSVEAAQCIAEWRADDTTQARLDGLAEKCSEGTLSSEEREEYDAYVRAIDFIGILQAKARSVLKMKSP